MPIDVLERAQSIADGLMVPLYQTARAQKGGDIHLNRVHLHAASRRTLCGKPVSMHGPTRLFQVDGCRRCADLALRLGVTFALDGGALVNLRRFQRRLIPRQMA